MHKFDNERADNGDFYAGDDEPTIRSDASDDPFLRAQHRTSSRQQSNSVITQPHQSKVYPSSEADGSQTLQSAAAWVNASSVAVNGSAAQDGVYRNPARVVTSPPPPAEYETGVRERARRRTNTPTRRGNEWVWVIIGVAMFSVVVLISVSMFIVLRVSRDTQDVLPTAPAIAALPTAVDMRGDGRGAPGSIVFTDGTEVQIKPWDGSSRLTILVVGMDRRPGETGLGYRTDTIMLLSMNPQTNSVGLLSIPRDLYVDVPNFYGMHRINEPMVLGELRETGYGPRLLMETVQYNLGIRVNNYLVIDFQAFIELIDSIGGIEVDLEYTINDPSYPSMDYRYEPFYLPAGHHLLDGETALKFARTRHGDNDFQRAERQQQVLYAIRDKLSDPQVMLGLLPQMPTIWDSVRANVYTGLPLDQIVPIGLYLKDVPQENITTGVIDYKYSVPFTTAQGAQVLLPNRERIATLMNEIFGPDYNQ
jgi:polyisoprenyl-teichoic acid--peptidoglycan teichoic acid transferase